MSQYEDQSDSCNAICPYCEHSYQVEGEDYSVDESRVEECEECGKSYRLTTNITISQDTEPDCELNNHAHEPEWHTWNGGGAYFCEVCGKCLGDSLTT